MRDSLAIHSQYLLEELWPVRIYKEERCDIYNISFVPPDPTKRILQDVILDMRSSPTVLRTPSNRLGNDDAVMMRYRGSEMEERLARDRYIMLLKMKYR